MLTLDAIPLGRQVRFVRFCHVSPVFRHKLLAMGAVPGSILTVVRVAPLGCPVQISLRGSYLSLRKKECQQLEVEYIDVESEKACISITENNHCTCR